MKINTVAKFPFAMFMAKFESAIILRVLTWLHTPEYDRIRQIAASERTLGGTGVPQKSIQMKNRVGLWKRDMTMLVMHSEKTYTKCGFTNS